MNWRLSNVLKIFNTDDDSRKIEAKPSAPSHDDIEVDVIITRTKSSNQGTLGSLQTVKGFSCKVIELPWRGNKSNISHIPAGVYQCKVHHSRKYGTVFHVTGVEGRTWVLTHGGNVAGDIKLGYKTHSKGCLLLGKRHGKLWSQDAVLNSKPYVRAFVEHMGLEPFVLSIVNAY